MATKKIGDLQLRSDADATCNFPVDDATQTWRVTLAQIRDFLLGSTTLGTMLTALTAKTALVAADEFLIADSAASYAGKKITRANLGKRLVTSQSATYAVLATDEVVICSGASFTATLPAASGLTGKVLEFHHNDSTAGRVYTIDGSGSETINGSLTKKICLENEVLRIICDGSNWKILERRIPSEWTSFTPTGTWSANSTYTGMWRREGDSIRVRCRVTTSGAPTSATLNINIPNSSAWTIDTAKFAAITEDLWMGRAVVRDAGSASYDAAVAYQSTTAVGFICLGITTHSGSVYDKGLSGVTQAAPFTFGASDMVDCEYLVPITNFEG